MMGLMQAEIKLPTYVFLADMVWFHVGLYKTWSRIEQREASAEEEYKRLANLPDRQEFVGHNSYQEWKQQIDGGELTVKQLRKQLLADHEESFVDGMIDRVERMQFYPRVKAAKDYGNLHIVVAPDGITDVLCYEFRSVKNIRKLAGHIEMVRTLAHMGAYLLGRPNILAHVHIRRDDKHHYVNEPVNEEMAENLLDWVGRPNIWTANWEAKRKQNGQP